MEIIAHRGASFDAPENSLDAIDRAIAQGADRIEIDVHVSRDGVAFVSHDETTERCGDAALTIATTDALELREVRLTNGEPLPLLSEVCERVAGRAALDVELKATGPHVAERAVAALRETDLLADALFTSFDGPTLRAVRRLGFAGRVGLLVGSKSLSPRQRAFEAWPLATMRRYGADALVIHHQLAHRALRRALRSRSLGFYVWLSMEDDERSHAERAETYARVARQTPDGVICAHVMEARTALRPSSSPTP